LQNFTTSLDLFHEATKTWFESNIGRPTAVQEEAWPAIAAGYHTLVSAPTGTGKTLSAFLVFLDSFIQNPPDKLQVIYISPLKALAGDIRENLYRPLTGIGDLSISVAIRTGDTTQSERTRMIKHPPNILITTPESLYLLLTSKTGKQMLKTAKAIIIDELHAMIDSKRGAHLMLSLARLDKLCEKPLQRIGLSATIKPLELAAEYLHPLEKVTIAAPEMEKKIQIEVVSPALDMYNLSEGSIWGDIAQSVYDQCRGVGSVIAFTDGRRFAEKLAYHVNLVACNTNFARTHHGCISKEQRHEAENDLRSGKLRLLCATSSMELGIDVGQIDRVIQVGCPIRISSLLQRLGRAGHNPGRVSVMKMYPRTVAESLQCGLSAYVANNSGIERSAPPNMCFDVLAQHLVSMAVDEGYCIDDVMDLLPQVYPFRKISREDVMAVLSMLAGDYEHKRDLPVRPRILYDRINGKVEGDAYSRMLAVSSGGTIPDLGMFSVKTESGKKIGELDEEFIFEERVGNKFMLGSFAWKIVQITKDTVVVQPTSNAGARPPFWKLGWLSRDLQTGIEFGKLLRGLSAATDLPQELRKMGLDEFAAENSRGFLSRQLEATGIFPDDRTIIVEHFSDETGENQLMIYSIFGRQVNAPLSILLQEYLTRATNVEVNAFEDDDGILLGAKNNAPFPKGLLRAILPENARDILEKILLSSSIFNVAFRHNAARALMMGVSRGKRNPLWVQRLRAAEFMDSLAHYEDHPLIRETKRECLEDFWNLPGLEWLLNCIQSGAVQVREIDSDYPSPMSLPLRRAAEAQFMYEYNPTTEAVSDMVKEALKIKPAAEQLAIMSERKKLPEDERQLHSLLMIEGDIIAGELNIPLEWFESLAEQNRAMYVEPGLWIAAEHFNEYDEPDLPNIIRRTLRYKGAHYPEQLAERYCISDQKAQEILTELGDKVIEDNGLYYHADLYERARNATISARRKQIKTVPSQNFAALLASRLAYSALPDLSEKPYPIALWESVLLPSRIKTYKTDLFNKFLSAGEMFYKITEGELSLHFYEDIDWNAEMECELEGDEKLIYDFLLKRGASFSASFAALLDGRPMHNTLLSLLGKGLVHTDNFVPVQQLISKAKKTTVKQKINARVMAMTSGRWEATRPLRQADREQLLERIFDKIPILSRETYKYFNSSDISWGIICETLRIWEYTGRVRRGYFVEGLSGMQFIRDKDFQGTVTAIEKPFDEITWLSAADPLQAWGKYIPHYPNREFVQASTSVVALKAGIPVAVFEKSGKSLRIFDNNIDVLSAFVKAFNAKNIFYDLKKLTVKEYPESTAFPKEFVKVMADYVLYRSY